MRAARLLIAVFSLALAACGGSGPGDAPSATKDSNDPLVVYSVNYPLAYFAERVGGELVEVVFPAPAGIDPAYWSPDAETIAAYQGADIILLNGATYAKWVDRATLPATRIIDTSAAFADQLIPLEEAVTHSHGPEGAHEHGGWAFTTWLDPMLAAQQAQAVAAALVELRPENEKEIGERLARLEKELATLDSRLAAAAEAVGDAPLIFSHPVYQYLIGNYDLNGVEVHWEPDEAPDGHAWDHLEELLESHPAKWMLWENEPLEETAAGLAEIGVESVVFDPCGNRPDEGNYLTVMAAAAAALEVTAQ